MCAGQRNVISFTVRMTKSSSIRNWRQRCTNWFHSGILLCQHERLTKGRWSKSSAGGSLIAKYSSHARPCEETWQMPLGLSANSVCSTYSHTDYVYVFIYKTFVYIIRIRQANQNALHNSKSRKSKTKGNPKRTNTLRWVPIWTQFIP